MGCNYCGASNCRIGWHAYASNKSTSKAVGKTEQSQGQDRGAAVEVVHSEPEVGMPGRKQRWSRDAYNAYQREYMRRRRERKPV